MKRKIFYSVCFLFLLPGSFLKQCAAQTLTVSPPGPVDSWINFQNLTASPSGAVAYEWFEKSHYDFCNYPAPTGIDQGQVNWAPPMGVWFCVATWSNGSTSVSNEVLVRELYAINSGGINTFNYNTVCSTTGKDLYVYPHKWSNQSCPGMFWDSYQWQFNGVDIPAATNYSYHATERGYYSCILSNTIGSASTDSLFAEIDPAIPPNTVFAMDTLCGFLSAPEFSGTDYQWYRDGAVISGASYNNYYYICNHTYKCRLTNTCGTYYTPEVEVKLCVPNESATVTASGPTYYCLPGSVNLTVASGANKTYQWYYSYGNSGPIAGATNQSYIANSTGYYSVIVTNTNGCSFVSSGAYVQPNTVYGSITPAGSLKFCPGGSVTLNANPGTGYSYQWKLNAVNIPGATSISYVANASGNYTVQVTASCGTSTSPTTIVNANAPTSYISPSGSISFCSGDSVVLHAQTGTGFSYQWQKGGVSIAGATSANYTATATGTYWVMTTSSCGTTFSNTAGVTAGDAPSAISISIAGTSQLCTGQSDVLSASYITVYPYLVSFQWRRNGIDISGANSSTYRVTQSGNYRVEITNQCGMALSPVQNIQINNNLTATITPSGPTAFCSGDSVIFSANTAPGFTWQWKKNGTNIPGATASTYSATNSGSYSVRVANPYGCSATSGVQAVTVNSAPSATITPGGPVTFCSGNSVLLSVPFGANKTYQWKKGSNIISGATLSSYTATTGGNYRVIVTNTVTGCSKTTATPTVVTVNPSPPATITPQGPITFCAGGSVMLNGNFGAGFTYQWKKGGTDISGATAKNYTATIAGTYKIKVTNSYGCSKLSTGVTVTVPCRENENVETGEGESAFDVKVFPNPSSGDFVFEISNVANEKISINIYDMIGKLVLSETISNSEFTISNPQLSPGIYSAVFANGENPDGSGQVKKVLKLIKTNL